MPQPMGGRNPTPKLPSGSPVLHRGTPSLDPSYALYQTKMSITTTASFIVCRRSIIRLAIGLMPRLLIQITIVSMMHHSMAHKVCK
jgi:hypothetical protein